MRKNLVVAAAVVTAVVLATGCGQKATARKTPEATPIETTCNRADDPANKGYALVGSGQTTVGSDHISAIMQASSKTLTIAKISTTSMQVNLTWMLMRLPSRY